jgi:hypothetical protein
MKPEYDFSRGERGKYFDPAARHLLPVYLNEDVQQYLLAKATDKGVPLSDLVNELLRRDIDLAEALNPKP